LSADYASEQHATPDKASLGICSTKFYILRNVSSAYVQRLGINVTPLKTDVHVIGEISCSRATCVDRWNYRGMH